MTCKENCLYYEICSQFSNADGANCKYYDFSNQAEKCKLFKDKSKLIDLPCKVGDYVYSIFSRRCWYLSSKDSLPKAKVVFVGLINSNYMSGGYFEVLDEDNKIWTFYFSDIGKVVFLTRKEAKRALEESKE